MMNDRELLELAAKAAGYVLKYSYKKNGLFFHYGKTSARQWNPLTDDGDALRLAVKLDMLVNVCGHLSYATNGESDAEEISEGQDKYAATRRAIVRAAAEIGKEMK